MWFHRLSWKVGFTNILLKINFSVIFWSHRMSWKVSPIFWKILHRISKISSFNVWKNSPMKTSHLFIYLFILRNLVNHFVPSLQIFVLTWQKPRSIHSHDSTVFHTLYLTCSLFMLFNILLFFQFPVIQSGSLNFGKKHLWVIVIFL